ncbi:MAG: hypothetical protein IKS41_05270 [Alphaproteobacteria bacterium]|nr:hypothetical protein [Alphaproteobacteria bacterium]
MKLNVKQLLFLLGLATFGVLILFFRFPIHLKSSLNDLFPVQIAGKVLPKEVTGKYANLLNIVIEADSFNTAKSRSDELISGLKSFNIQNITYHVSKNSLAQSLDYFKTYQNSFLSPDVRRLLLNSDTQKIREQALNRIQTSWMPPVAPLQDDPFLLLSDYVQGIPKPASAWAEREGVLWQEKDGKHYILTLIQFNQGNIYDLLEKIRLIRQISVPKNSDYQVHLSGAPLHTAQMFEKTKWDISLISCAALLMLLVLTYLLFHHIGSVFMVFFNLAVAFISGLWCVLLFIPDVHFLTFAFGASLVGICIDYSFHRFSCQDKKIPPDLFKNIFYSFLTTVACFIPLLLSDLPLLKQIAVFTIGGLSGTFIWILITPLPATKDLKSPSFGFSGIPFKKTFFVLFLLVGALGLIKIQINHSPENLYKPSKDLQQEETFARNLNGNTFNWLLLIRGDNLQSVLEKEEAIRETNLFFGLSTMLPSLQRQKQNLNLIQNLYNQESKELKDQLGLKKMPTPKQTPLVDEKTFQNQFEFLLRQFIVKTLNGVWSITPLTKKMDIADQDALIFEPSKYVSDILDRYASKTYQILCVSFGLLFIILLFVYRKKAFLYLLPSLLGGFGTLGILSLCGQGITFFHLLALFVVIGLSMDYTIFLFGSHRPNRSVLFAFISSLIGFGLLSFIHFHMIAIMGQTIALGLLLSFMVIWAIKKD